MTIYLCISGRIYSVVNILTILTRPVITISHFHYLSCFHTLLQGVSSTYGLQSISCLHCTKNKLSLLVKKRYRQSKFVLPFLISLSFIYPSLSKHQDPYRSNAAEGESAASGGHGGGDPLVVRRGGTHPPIPKCRQDPSMGRTLMMTILGKEKHIINKQLHYNH